MKKVLLVAVIALFTLSASAVNRPHVQKAKIKNEKNLKLATLGNLKDVKAKLKMKNAEQKAQKIAQIKSTRRAGEEVVDLLPAYSIYSYFYTELLDEYGGFFQSNMYDGASFLVDGDKAYFAPFEDADYVEGVHVATETDDDGALIEIYEFTTTVIAETKDGTALSLEPCDLDPDNGFAIRNGETTYYGYYWADYNEFYIPEILALFDANSTETNVFSELYVAAFLDLLPQREINKYITKGTFTGASFWTDEEYNLDVSGDCLIFMTESAFFIKGANGADEPDAWIEYAIDEDDPSIATVPNFQFLGGPYQWQSNGMIGIIITYGLTPSEIEGYVDLVEPTFKITDNLEGTTTIACTNDSFQGELIWTTPEFGNENGNFYLYNDVDMTITITYEPAYPDEDDNTAIKSVKSEKTNANGTYNLNGQRVSDNAKGLIIKDGKKYISK